MTSLNLREERWKSLAVCVVLSLLSTACSCFWWSIAAGACSGTETGQNEATLLCRSGDILLIGMVVVNVLLGGALFAVSQRDDIAKGIRWTLMVVYALWIVLIASPFSLLVWLSFLARPPIR